MEWSDEDDVNCGITHLKNEDLIVAVVMISKWKLLKTEEGDLKDALCYAVALVPKFYWFQQSAHFTQKSKNKFRQRPGLLLYDKLV